MYHKSLMIRVGISGSRCGPLGRASFTQNIFCNITDLNMLAAIVFLV